jgi:transcriptional regulator with XRE-family HTH domain
MSGEDRSAHAGLNIGRTLELARKERGLSLNQVEQATKIRATYLQALERENFDVLPAVYMQGSLRTYANFLHLDGEAMARELRRRQTSQHEPQGPAHAELQRGDYFDRSLIFLGGAADVKSQKATEEEDDAGSGSIFASGNLVYLGSAGFLVLVLVAVALTLILPEDSQPEVSQIHKPMISQAPSQVARSGGEENKRSQPQEDDEQGADDKNDNRQPDQQTWPDEDDGEPTPTVQNQVGSQLVQAPPPDATATPAATPAAPQTPQNAPAEQPDAASTPPPPAPPAQGNAAPVDQGGGQLAQAPPPSDARGTGEPTTTSRAPRGNGGFQVQIVVGAEDPVRITGSPVADR